MEKDQNDQRQPAEENDDQPVGRVLSRREVLALLGVAGSVALIGGSQVFAADSTIYLPLVAKAAETATLVATVPAATATPALTATPIPACVVKPEKTEGPYFVDELLNRSDIRADPTTGVVKDGTRLDLTFHVSRLNGSSCTAFSGAQVDIWHCDAGGLYSDVSANNTLGQKFLRGYQLTDSSGLAQFVTIYPGWYTGRAVHIHFKIRATTTAGANYEFTSQLFFDDTLSTQLFALAPYKSRGTRDTLNSTDNIYANNGSQLLLSLTQTSTGYSATFDIGLSVA
jgi:protocatechuate 3,4-dioxygenase beta subunit